ncbi:preprotein translocase subunit YajC [Leucobacter japonicus]|uniref:preprotein translocase subunit YajC n=1 Tax=Leucobacter japonicus TaxID=1461259 RepID=UPI0006A79D74|nr:preprotein translocase subunit YajC [Leucobacter japonicus]
MALDPITIVMFALIALLIFFMFRNGKKRQAAMQELQNNVRPGAEVMLQSGIYGTIDSIDEEDNKVTVRSGTSTFVVHRNAVSQVVSPVDAAAAAPAADLAPDDDPAFGERLGAQSETSPIADAAAEAETASQNGAAAAESDIAGNTGETPDADETGTGSAPKA